MFSLQNVSKVFAIEGKPVPVLQDLSLEINAGEWVALTGPSGCGKTTLLQLLGGLDRPTSGKILLDGEDLARLSASRLTALRHSRIGFVFQSYQLLPELDALENAVLPALQWGAPRAMLRQRAEQLLRKFGLAERLHHRPRELSGGEQQRVAIARALINAPDILLADEPTGNLDADSAGEVMRIFQQIHSQEHKTIVMVTHDQAIAAQASRIVTIKKDNR